MGRRSPTRCRPSDVRLQRTSASPLSLTFSGTRTAIHTFTLHAALRLLPQRRLTPLCRTRATERGTPHVLLLPLCRSRGLGALALIFTTRPAELLLKKLSEGISERLPSYPCGCCMAGILKRLACHSLERARGSERGRKLKTRRRGILPSYTYYFDTVKVGVWPYSALRGWMGANYSER